MIPSIFFNNPIRKEGFFQRMSEVKALIAKGRVCKAEGSAAKYMLEAYEKVTALLDEIQPLRYLVKLLLWIAGAFATGYAAAIVTLWLQKG
ncbi:hypothetical protein FJY63_06880 [Candidatus Sumerlaeota bacterium]|nr:hypothetical protein [Candidatus Sumerlaeota bacterium]